MVSAARVDAHALCVLYESEHIYNADEGALFYRTLPRRTYSFGPIHGGDVRKDRITFLVATNAIGTFKDIMVVGYSKTPTAAKMVGGRMRWAELSGRAFYRCNPASAWMRRDIFAEWLQSFDAKLSAPSLLLVDNASVHDVSIDSLNLKHVRLEFLQ